MKKLLEKDMQKIVGGVVNDDSNHKLPPIKDLAYRALKSNKPVMASVGCFPDEDEERNGPKPWP